MTIDIAIDAVVLGHGVFIGYTPRTITVTLSDIPAGSGPVPIQVSSTGSLAALLFSKERLIRGTSVLDLTVDPAIGSVSFFVAGEFRRASETKDDAEVTVQVTGSAPVVEAKQALTVRVRKNANTMTAGERDRFLKALEEVNLRGLGPFQAIRDMHVSGLALAQAHNVGPPIFNSHFLPWHRAYLLDLERHLQSIDPTVCLPYWRFDEVARNVLSPDFMGSTTGGSVTLSSTNPLQSWRVDGTPLFVRSAFFTESTSHPFDIGQVDSEAQVLAAGPSYLTFRGIEGSSHNGAHTSFDGDLSSAGTAPKDPLFFLLHCNVDRLWAKWQDLVNRFDKTSSSSYSPLGQSNPANLIGHRVQDSMWPWDNVTGPPQRPNNVPRAGFPASPIQAAPGPAPTVGSMIDYQGRLDSADEVGFDYDDVPFYEGD